jgi:hypothetical protein
MRTTAIIAVLAGIGWAPQMAAQERAQPVDSLAVELRRLQARLDSLEQVLQRLVRQGTDTTEVQDELAALRAAARRAAGEAQGADTTAPQESRTRDLSVLNPEISVTGDVIGSFLAPAGESTALRATPREFEFSFQSALDPYTRTKIFATYEEELEIAGLELEDEGEEEDGHSGFAIEEAYLYWVGLPGAIGLKVGKFRQEIGLFNRWHTHALYEIDRPLAAVAFLGDDGLIQTGLSLSSPSLTIGPSHQTLYLEATQASNEALFGDGGDLSFLGRFQSFWDLGATSYFQVGASGVTGTNDEIELDSRLLGIDFLFRWSPRGQSLHRALELRGEWYFAEQELGDVRETGHGGYGQGSFRLNRQFVLGTRVDYLDNYGEQPNLLQIAPSVSWWQSEWVRLRLQYNFVKPEALDPSHTVMLQVVWAMGPHKHESY